MMIELIVFDHVQDKLIEDIYEGLKNIFGSCTLSDIRLHIPEDAYDGQRRQYDSNPFLLSVVEYSKNARGDKILGITKEDLFTGNLNFIFGHAYVGGKVCIVSIHRLDPGFYGQQDYALFLERCLKEAVHELGHSFGLSHCGDKRCVMVFSNSITDVDNKNIGFCRRCGSLVGVR